MRESTAGRWSRSAGAVSGDGTGRRRPVRLFAGQCRAVRERPAQRRPPKRHLIVRLAPRADAASRTQQRDPEPERQGRHDPWWIVAMPVARQLRSGAGDPLYRAPVETRIPVVIPSFAVALRKPAVHCIAQSHLQPLQRAVECGADRGIPRIEPDGPFPVTPGGVEIRAQTLARQRRLELIEEIVRVGEVLDAGLRSAIFSLYTPDPPLPPGMRPGFSFCSPDPLNLVSARRLPASPGALPRKSRSYCPDSVVDTSEPRGSGRPAAVSLPPP